MKPNELLAKIYAENYARQEEPVPKGYMTVMEWAKAWGVARETANRAILKGMALGLMERADIKRSTGIGIRKVSFFAAVK